jgi:hypothetical protein
MSKAYIVFVVEANCGIGTDVLNLVAICVDSQSGEVELGCNLFESIAHKVSGLAAPAQSTIAQC